MNHFDELGFQHQPEQRVLDLTTADTGTTDTAAMPFTFDHVQPIFHADSEIDI